MNEDKKSSEEAQDWERLSERIARMSRSVDAPSLWERIEEDLDRLPRPPRRMQPGFLRRRRIMGLAGFAAATLLCCFFLFFQSARTQAQASLIVDEAESMALTSEFKQLEGELVRLESVLLEDRSPDGDTDFLLGQVKLLDGSIEVCRKVWQSNRMNREVLKSMIYCYGKKLELVNTLLDR